GPGLGQLARPDELRLHDGLDVRRANGELAARHLQLRELRGGHLALLLEDVALLLRQGDAALLGLGPPEELTRALERAARLVACGAHVVELLRRARAGPDQAL